MIALPTAVSRTRYRALNDPSRCLVNRGSAAENEVRIVVLHTRQGARYFWLYCTTTAYVKEDMTMKWVVGRSERGNLRTRARSRAPAMCWR